MMSRKIMSCEVLSRRIYGTKRVLSSAMQPCETL